MGQIHLQLGPIVELEMRFQELHEVASAKMRMRIRIRMRAEVRDRGGGQERSQREGDGRSKVIGRVQ